MNPNSLMDTAEHPSTPLQAAISSPRPSSARVHVDLAGQSHQGRVRPNNEDHFLVVRFGRFLQMLSTNLPDGCVPHDVEDAGYGMTVADGMGGLVAGEVASRMAITLLVNLVLQTPDWILVPGEPQMEEVGARAVERFRNLDEAVSEQARREPRLAGMGTTLTMALSLATDLVIAHVGDSPAYLFRQGKLHKLTHPHTLAQELADLGAISDKDVASHRLRHVLTQAIGGRGTGGEPEVRRFRLADGDRLLLCTDGLTEMVDEATIAAELHQGASANESCQALIDLALQRGGKDNVTVVVASYRIAPGP